MLETYQCSIDNLTILGTPTISTKSIYEYFHIQYQGMIKKSWVSPNGRYFFNLAFQNGSFLQITSDSDKKQALRVEFNPNKITDYGFDKLMMDILKRAKDTRVSRIDVAVDLYGIDMNDYNILDFAGRKIAEYKTSARELETIYFGVGESEDKTRIYNKAKEQKIKENYNWWRVEAQLRGDKAMEFAHTGNSPFSKIKIVRKNDFSRYDIKTRAMLVYLQENPDKISELSINSRTRYKKMLAEQIEEVEVQIDLDKIVERYKEDLLGELASWMNYCVDDIRDKTKFKEKVSVLIDGDERRSLND